MILKKASAKLGYNILENGDYSVKVRVYYDKNKRRFKFPTTQDFFISKVDYEKLALYHKTRNDRMAEKTRILHSKILPFLEKASKLCDSINPFSYEKFEKLYYLEEINTEKSEETEICLYKEHEKVSDVFFRSGKISSSGLYKLAGVSLKKFVEQLDLTFLNEYEINNVNVLSPTSINKLFLEKYELWMVNVENNSLTTVGIYLRNTRAIYNQLIKDKKISADIYPFGKNGYSLPAPKKKKRALQKDQILSIINYFPENYMEQRAKDFYILTYLANGMNMTDILNLKWTEIDFEKNELKFYRKKTLSTTRSELRECVVKLNDLSKTLINRLCAIDNKPNGYVFPFLKPNLTEQQKKEVVKNIISKTNKYMNIIARKLDIPGNITTYTARHSFATILLRSNVPLPFISEALTHTTLRATQNYLGSFEDEQTEDFLSNLL